MTDQPTDPTTRMPLPGSTAAGRSAGVRPATAAATGRAPAAAPRRAPPPAPAWTPARRRADDGRMGSVVFGLVLLGLGLWFFASETLRLEMPDI